MIPNRLKLLIGLGLFASLSFIGCTKDDVLSTIKKISGDSLSTADYVTGLKSTLSVSTDTSVKITSKLNGFFRDAAIKVLWPSEAKTVVDVLNNSGYSQKVDTMILKMNRAAEMAAVEATPIFKQSITNMGFADALSIVKGSDTAATQYFRKTTYTPLYNAFSPKVDNVLSQPINGTSVKDYWSSIISIYNTLGSIAGYPAVNTNLTQYVTERALYGVFYKLAQQEVNIRNNPLQQVTSAIQKIFGKRNARTPNFHTTDSQPVTALGPVQKANTN